MSLLIAPLIFLPSIAIAQPGYAPYALQERAAVASPFQGQGIDTFDIAFEPRSNSFEPYGYGHNMRRSEHRGLLQPRAPHLELEDFLNSLLAARAAEADADAYADAEAEPWDHIAAAEEIAQLGTAMRKRGVLPPLLRRDSSSNSPTAKGSTKQSSGSTSKSQGQKNTGGAGQQNTPHQTKSPNPEFPNPGIHCLPPPQMLCIG
ncbi:hypothetical protein MMC10_010620 [Thelotrema lepadinum]|nr:hypothetical protein [Thelotrema lepadinum]